MSDEKRNGYTNWATWYVVSEMENHKTWYEAFQRLVRTKASAEEFKKVAEQSLFPTSNVTTYGKMSRKEFANVDWTNIRETLLGD